MNQPATHPLIEVRPIGVVRSPRSEVVDDHWGTVTSAVVLNPDIFEIAAVTGLEEFSHLEVVFFFNRCSAADVVTGARHPRGHTDLPLVGVLAQRVKDRPNHLGVSRCEIVDVDGLTVHVRGLDAVDGTPVLDVKPYLSSMVPPPSSVREPAWLAEVMHSYY